MDLFGPVHSGSELAGYANLFFSPYVFSCSLVGVVCSVLVFRRSPLDRFGFVRL